MHWYVYGLLQSHISGAPLSLVTRQTDRQTPLHHAMPLPSCHHAQDAAFLLWRKSSTSPPLTANKPSVTRCVFTSTLLHPLTDGACVHTNKHHFMKWSFSHLTTPINICSIILCSVPYIALHWFTVCEHI
jgi:hypothetical protein